ncbi:MAG: hypothetical protein RJQ01_05875 [Microcella sp.]|uniref:hypothetical protein n=1 Tax=Microcella sp. TaxID=1913979 RepID=UPI003315EC0F
MSDAGDARRFVPRPRSDIDRRSRTDAQNVRDELLRILHRCESVIEAGRESFAEGAPHDDVASMVVMNDDLVWAAVTVRIPAILLGPLSEH